MYLALSCDEVFLKRLLTKESHGYIHTVFKRTVNLVFTDSEELFTLANCELDEAPNSLIINIPNFEQFNFQKGEKVVVRSRQIILANKLTVSLGNCQSWTAKLPKLAEDLSIARENLSFVRKELLQAKVILDLEKEKNGTNNFHQIIHEKINIEGSQIIQALLVNDYKKAYLHAKNLIGLGVGLTPSGDDFLLGLMTVLNVEKVEDENYQEFCQRIVERAGQATNEISFMALKKASQGQVRQSIIVLVSELFYGNKTDLSHALGKVLGIGSTSGADIVTGIVFGMDLVLLKNQDEAGS